MSQALQFSEADLLLTIAKWFFISLNSGIRQIKVHESNVDIIISLYRIKPHVSRGKPRLLHENLPETYIY